MSTSSEDEAADTRMLVPLFLTADVASSIIDKLLEVAPKFFDGLSGPDDGRDIVEFVVIKDSVAENKSTLEALNKGTRPPTTHFQSPYINTSIDDLTALFTKHLCRLNPNFSGSVFVVADSETAEHGKSILLVSPISEARMSQENRKSESARVDFEHVLNWCVQIDIGNLGFEEMLDYVDADGIVRGPKM